MSGGGSGGGQEMKNKEGVAFNHPTNCILHTAYILHTSCTCTRLPTPPRLRPPRNATHCLSGFSIALQFTPGRPSICLSVCLCAGGEPWAVGSGTLLGY